MFNLAYEMAWLPVRLAWRGVRWAWRSARGQRDRRGERPWQGMAQSLGTAVPPVPRLPAPDGNGTVPFRYEPSRSAPAAGAQQEPAAPAAQPASDGSGTEEWPELARFHCREGDGFKLIFHFLMKQQRVRRTVWLDFTRLARRMGRDPAWAMRARLGHAQMRYAVDRPSQPWGRIELPEVRLAIDSTRGQKARSFMLDTLDAVNAMIDEGGIALVSGRHQKLPDGDGLAVARIPSPRKARASAATATDASQGELPLVASSDAGASDGAEVPAMPPVVPDASEDNAGLPRGVVPEHVCTGILAAAGITERQDSTGRQYRIFYADVDVDGRLSRQTGVDLERALKAANAHVGMRVRLQHLGHVPVNGGRHRRKVWQATVLPG